MNKHGIRLITAVVTSSMIVTPVLAAPSVDDLKKEKASKQNEVSSLQSQLTTLMGKVNTLESELIQTGEDITCVIFVARCIVACCRIISVR